MGMHIIICTFTKPLAETCEGKGVPAAWVTTTVKLYSPMSSALAGMLRVAAVDFKRETNATSQVMQSSYVQKCENMDP